MGLINSPTCRKCGTEEETSVNILCECDALASLRYTYLGYFFLDPEDIKKQSVGVIWNFVKEQDSFNTLKAELNPICLLLALFGTHQILHVNR